MQATAQRRSGANRRVCARDMKVTHGWVIVLKTLAHGCANASDSAAQERSKPTRLRRDMKVTHGWVIVLKTLAHGCANASDSAAQERSKPTRLRRDMKVTHGWVIVLKTLAHGCANASDSAAQERSKPTRLRRDMKVTHGWVIFLNKRSLAKNNASHYHAILLMRGWSSLAARRAHNPKVAGFESCPRYQICEIALRFLNERPQRGLFRLPALRR